MKKALYNTKLKHDRTSNMAKSNNSNNNYNYNNANRSYAKLHWAMSKLSWI